MEWTADRVVTATDTGKRGLEKTSVPAVADGPPSAAKNSSW